MFGLIWVKELAKNISAHTDEECVSEKDSLDKYPDLPSHLLFGFETFMDNTLVLR